MSLSSSSDGRDWDWDAEHTCPFGRPPQGRDFSWFAYGSFCRRSTWLSAMKPLDSLITGMKNGGPEQTTVGGGGPSSPCRHDRPRTWSPLTAHRHPTCHTLFLYNLTGRISRIIMGRDRDPKPALVRPADGDKTWHKTAERRSEHKTVGSDGASTSFIRDFKAC